MRSEIILAVAIGTAAIVALAYQGSSEGTATPVTQAETAAPTAAHSPPPLDAVEGRPLPPGHPPLEAQAGLPAGHPMTDDRPAMPPAHPAMGPDGHGIPSTRPVEPLSGGVTVGQLFADAGLEGRSVKLAARVMKVTPNVLGKTWLHVQDGTGDASRRQDDLVVTTSGQPAVGDLVVLEGRVVRDKDLGSGYRYEVLLEDATVRPRSATGEEAGEPGRD